MNILIIGLGVIGTEYGFVFHKAGHNTEHLIRKSSNSFTVDSIDVELLDGRENPKGEAISASYPVVHASSGKTYDLILVSVPEGGIAGVLDTLQSENIHGTLLLFCGIWQSREELNLMLSGWNYIIGYPVAGGNMKNGKLNCCLFDHIMLESREKADCSHYDKVVSLFTSCRIKTEIPYDMLEWIWLHMAINAGVITVAGKYGDISDTTKAAEGVMDSSKALSEAVRSIRETTKIIASRGVNLKNYSNELLPYKTPAGIAGIVMKKIFAGNLLTRKIMTLHNNLNDLLFVCGKIFELGQENSVSAPIFYENYRTVIAKADDCMKRRQDNEKLGNNR